MDTPDDARRLRRDERREQVLDAAMPVVARSGFAGTTTDQVAVAAGVSQPYVVRMFGGKADLLLALFERTGQRLLDAFASVEPGPEASAAMGAVYVDLVRDRNLLLVVLHGFSASDDPRIGAVGRRILDDVARLHHERTGGGAEAARDFLARGMLINTLLAVGAWEHTEGDHLAAVASSLVSRAEVARSAPTSA